MDQNLKDFKRLMIFSLILCLMMMIKWIQILITGNFTINISDFILPIAGFSIMFFLNNTYKNEFIEQINKEQSEDDDFPLY